MRRPFRADSTIPTGVNLEPTPVQKPGLPIWIGSWGSNAGLRRVARLADGWLSSAGPGHQSPEQFAEDVKRLNAFLVQEGKDPATFPNAVSTMALFISEDQEELARLGGPGYVPRPAGVGVAQPAARPDEDPHAHDMVGTRAAMPGQGTPVEGRWCPGALSRPPRSGPPGANASLSG